MINSYFFVETLSEMMGEGEIIVTGVGTAYTGTHQAIKLKKRLAQEFKDQLTIGVPTEQDEKALRKLSRQMKENKVVVKLHLRYTLHAKLYLAYSNDKRVPVVGFLGSSNLTLAGLAKQGELNIDVMDQDAANKLATWFDDRWKDRDF